MNKIRLRLLSLVLTFSLLLSTCWVGVSAADDSAPTFDQIKTAAIEKAPGFEKLVLETLNTKDYTFDYRGSELSSWAKREVYVAVKLGLVPSSVHDYFLEPITRREFADLAVQSISTFTGISRERLLLLVSEDHYFSDCQDQAVATAAALGIVNGMPGGKFLPNKTITRQEAAAMLSRMAKLLGYEETSDNSNFSDISGLWGAKDINYIASMSDPYSNNSVMNGKGNNRFAPNDIYDRQQAIMTILRLVNAVTSKTTGYTGDGLPKDLTGFDNQNYNWGTSSEDAQNIDDLNFPNGKWVREDGMAVLYISHESSIDSVDYTIHIAAANGKASFTDTNYATLISDTFASSTELLTFEVIGKNKIKVVSDWLDELYTDYNAPDGNYVLVKAASENGIGEIPGTHPVGVDFGDGVIAETGMMTVQHDDGKVPYIKSETLLDQYISIDDITPVSDVVKEKIKNLSQEYGDEGIVMKGERTCLYYYWTDEKLFSKFVGTELYGLGVNYNYLIKDNKAVSRINLHKDFLKTKPIVGDSTPCTLELGDLYMEEGPVHKVPQEPNYGGWQWLDRTIYANYEIDEETGLLTCEWETIPLIYSEQKSNGSYYLIFSINTEGKLVADGLVITADWSSSRIVASIHLEEE